MTEDRILFETEVGSFMWGMGTKESDRDVMHVYAQPTRDILSGRVQTHNKPQRKFKQYSWEWDYQYFEIGHLINLLIKGNCNALWDVTSPVVLTDSEVLKELRDITVNNLSKASYASIHGMAISNFKDQEKRPKLAPNKAYRQCLRTLMFGIHLFEHGEVKFAPVTKEVTAEDIEQAFVHIAVAHERTKLPEVPDEHKFRNFLYNLRIAELEQPKD